MVFKIHEAKLGEIFIMSQMAHLKLFNCFMRNYIRLSGRPIPNPCKASIRACDQGAETPSR